MRVHFLVGGQDYRRGLERDASSRSKRTHWTCPKTATVGDPAFILVLGEGVFARGTVASPPKPSENFPGRYAAYINSVELLAAPVPLRLLRLKFPEWGYARSAQSYTTVDDPLASRVLEYFQAGELALVDLEEGETAVVEGTPKSTTITRYERRRDARLRCLAKWGCRCAACGMAFGEVYGPALEGFIHIHHLEAVASKGKAYSLVPERDLRPLCPNCHAVSHRSQPPFTVAQIKALLTQGKRRDT